MTEGNIRHWGQRRLPTEAKRHRLRAEGGYHLHQPGILVGFEEAVQVADTGWVTHLAERFRLDGAALIRKVGELGQPSTVAVFAGTDGCRSFHAYLLDFGT